MKLGFQPVNVLWQRRPSGGRWHAGDQALRWTATGLLEAQTKFRRVKGYRELDALQHRLNPSLMQQVRVA